MQVAIRVDAALVRGTGHVMRCLCLADALRERGASIAFVTRDLPQALHTLVTGHGHQVVALEGWPGASAPAADLPAEAAWSTAQQDADAAQTVAALAALGLPVEILVVDHYALGLRWEQAARAGAARLVAIDDLAREHDCDVLLDQNFYAAPEARYAGRIPAAARALLGPQHALLRPEFRSLRADLAPRSGALQRILVFLGGMDAANLTGRALDALDAAGLAGVATDVVIGAGHPQRDALAARCASRGATTCHIQTPHIGALMAAADLAVGAGGVATWERAALGVPTLAICIAENQREVLDDCSRAGLVCLAPADTVPALTEQLRALAANPGLRVHLSRQGMACVDGLGASRVVAALLGPAGIALRPAGADDSADILAWRNAPEVRAASRSDAPIAAAAHQAWFDRVLADPARHLLVGERDGAGVGVVRFDPDGPQSYEISIYLAPGRAGRGEGAALLAAAEAWLRRAEPQARLIHAEVMAHNVVSLRLFERGGYRWQSSRYSKDLVL
ncbi:UDP-2,4-diacetamido-2,4,6-trideoxy-beta-L-altropyranose hydrolase [Bordetella genomosp. 1]|uniref:UDP-2,4-diacetamido-2,4, 6-trideoxy-beta-L-altropyranose hydrolase n=1 Tax=Bordetella genomosp. 1 TaxID=1395607 RepID=A0A261RSW2_9BORD|nr:UDP-2,4-diacetamido-2,4,6-trideoxy-beta-L-altropyranose hydrolase [Bordetella genomosp. 1]OZI28156.1 UDP-2,4-diacetamido-2,4,6-trideoxy-beta-L-altropyranose hydrolase [Bordetella genomosp. 1]